MIKCLICNQEFNKRVSLCNHLSRKHKLLKRDYYDQYIKSDTSEGICKYDGCDNPTIFIDIEKGYADCCCLEHTNLYRYGVKSNLNLKETKEKAQKNSHTKEAIQKQKETNLKKYGSIAPLQNEDIKKKAIETNIKKYGVDNPSKNQKIKNKIKQTKQDKYGDENYNNREKAKQTCLEHYGVEHQLQAKEVQEKLKQTIQKKYGADNYMDTKEFRDKSKQTCNDKYGTDYITQSEYFKKKSKSTLLERYGVENCQQNEDIKEKTSKSKQKKIQVFEETNNCTNIKQLKQLYGQGWLAIKDQLHLLYNGRNTYIDNNDIDKIKSYTEVSTRSRIEDDVYDFISAYTTVKRDDRQQIKPLELDLYIPDKKVAIEVDGTFYHAINNGFDKNKHLLKTIMCEKLGIRLIHITDWEWKNKQDICKSIILSAIGIHNTVVYARNCEIKEVSTSEAYVFLEENHIQGYINSHYRLGLYYNNELIQFICIGKSRYKQDEYELLRMCTKINTQVVGGFSKLIKHQPYNNIISYIDRSKFTGKGYYNIGFIYISDTPISYSYYKQNHKLNRVSAQKHKLAQLLGDKFDETQTEYINMVSNGWNCVYDCGNIKVQYKRV